MRRLLPLLLLPLTACTLSSDPAADSVGKAAKASPSEQPGDPDARRHLAVDSAAPTLTFDAPGMGVKFMPEKATAKAGLVNIRFATDGVHNLTLDGPDRLVWGQEAGGPADVAHAVRFEPGEYRFYCSVPGHESAGMVGTITVT